MRIEDLKKVKDRRPFQPFVIRTADGRELTVKHPDVVAWDVDARRTVVCMCPDGSWDFIDVGLITSLNVAPPVEVERPGDE